MSETQPEYRSDEEAGKVEKRPNLSNYGPRSGHQTLNAGSSVPISTEPPEPLPLPATSSDDSRDKSAS